MKRQNFKSSIIIGALALLLSSCSSSDDSTVGSQNPVEDSKGKYVVLTAEWQVNDGSGYYATYDEMPTGEVDNIGGYSIQARNYGGFRHYKDWVFSRANLAGETGILRYSIGANGKLKESGFIKCGTSAQHVIVDETTGFYFDGERGNNKVQKFNPSTMQRIGELDLTSAIEKGEGISKNVFTGIQTLASKEGKLFVSITYSPEKGNGNIDNTGQYTLAVVDIASGQVEKTITHHKARNHGYSVSEYPAWTLGDDGALYFMTLGWDFNEKRELVQQNAFIFRIKAGETEFDKKWEVNTRDLGLPDGASLWSFRTLNGKLYIDASIEKTSPMSTNFYNNIYAFYAVDIASKQVERIKGVPNTVFGLSTGNVEIVDNQVFLRVINREEGLNAYYKVDTSDFSAIPAFNVIRGGEASGFIRLSVK
ncbi:hypothetical protein VSO92_00305 [Myroides pelagicus]|uniref:DUF4374 domain-containing protein n=1 Tax=Myroides pelagicus TaxID=270914 RepID=UPI002DB797CC|nr:hypothetical protein [Myroides pelagicus]MEC4112561.1 hypothetical protein [Myroides pelagicus]